MAKLRLVFLAVILVGGLLLFGYGIYKAAYCQLWAPGPLPRLDLMPQVLSSFVSSLNALLAANLGVLLGIRITQRSWTVRLTATNVFQWIAGGAYVVMLIAAVVFWARADFKTDLNQVVSLLPELGNNAKGIVIAIIAAALGMQSAASGAAAPGAAAPPAASTPAVPQHP